MVSPRARGADRWHERKTVFDIMTAFNLMRGSILEIAREIGMVLVYVTSHIRLPASRGPVVMPHRGTKMHTSTRSSQSESLRLS